MNPNLYPKYNIGDTVRLVRSADQDQKVCQAKSITIVESKIHCIEIKASGLTYILESGHHCREPEIIAPHYQQLFLDLVERTIAGD